MGNLISVVNWLKPKHTLTHTHTVDTFHQGLGFLDKITAEKKKKKKEGIAHAQ